MKDGWFWMKPNPSIVGWYFVQSTHCVLKASGPFVCSACLVVKCVEQLSPKPRNQPNEQVGLFINLNLNIKIDRCPIDTI